MPTPSTWESLAGPSFRLSYSIGPQVQLVDLATAPVGRDVARGWVAAMGQSAAARFVRALAPNIAAVQTDAVETCRQVARGYSAVGIGVTADALAIAAQGGNLDIIVPTPVAYDMEGQALRKGAGAAARRLADFAVSPAAMQLYARDALIVSLPGVSRTIQSLPPAESRDLELIDFSSLDAPTAALIALWRDLPRPNR